MRMRNLAIQLAVIAVFPACAQAAIPAHPTPPSPAAEAKIMGIVQQDWVDRAGVAGPWCGKVNVHFVIRPDDQTWAGLSLYSPQLDPCGILVNVDNTADPAQDCQIQDHEVGHLIQILRPDGNGGWTYNSPYASLPGGPNRNDPDHSPYPWDIMFWQVSDQNMPPRCAALDNPTPSFKGRHRVHKNIQHPRPIVVDQT